MKLERVRPEIFVATLHAQELTALVAAARLVLEHEELLPAEATARLAAAVRSYDDAIGHLNQRDPRASLSEARPETAIEEVRLD
ncbi:MAG: hypothetical protein ACRDQ2_04910 [Gaiellales bacterium]